MFGDFGGLEALGMALDEEIGIGLGVRRRGVGKKHGDMLQTSLVCVLLGILP